MTTVLKMMAYYDELAPIMSNDPLNTCFCKILSQAKPSTSPLK